MMRTTFIFVVAVLAIWPPLAQAEPVNRFCPVMTEEEIDPAITTTYRGQTIAFCCDLCLTKFEADPQKYMARLSKMVPHQADPRHIAEDRAAHNHDSDPVQVSPDQHDLASTHSHGDQKHSQAEEGESKDSPPLLGRFHPVIVHFPVAGIPLALLGYVLWLFTGRDSFAKADIPPLMVATTAAIVAVITGNIAHDSMRFSSSMHVIVERHQFMGTTVMIVCLVTTAIRLWRWNRLIGQWRWVYGAGLTIASALIAVTGFLGGSLVFGPDHLKW